MGGLGRAPRSQLWARVASTPTLAWAVWVDGRDLGQRERAVYAARIQTDGGVLDPVGVRLATFEWVHDVAIATDGTRVLVAFSAETAGSTHIYTLRLDAMSGAFLDAAPVQLANNPDDDFAPEATFDGQNFVVAWVTESQPHRAQVRRVDPATGAALPGIVNLGGTLGLNRVTVGSIGGGHSVVMFDQVDVDGGSSTQLVAFQNGVTSAFPSIPGPRARGGRIGPANATSYFAVWLDSTNGFPEILGARVDATAFIDTSPLRIAAGNDGGLVERDFGDPVLTSGPSIVVPWLDLSTQGPELFVRRVDPATGVVQPQLSVSATRTELGALFIAPLGASFVGVYGRTISGTSRYNDDIFYTMGPTGGALLSASYEAQANATGVAVGSEDLVAWSTFFDTDTEIRFSSWNPDAGAWAAIDSFVSPSFEQDGVDLSLADSRVLASFRRDTNVIEAGRIDPQAVGVDNVPINVCSVAGTRFLAKNAFDGTQWWTTWLDDRAAARAAFASRVTLNGNVLDGSGRQLPFTDPRSLAAAGGPGQALVAAHSGTGALQLARVFSDGGIDPTRLERTGLFFARPTVSFDGVNYLVVWESDLPDGGEALVAARFDTSLVQLDVPPLSIREMPDVDAQSVGFDGIHHVLTWTEPLGGSARLVGKRLTVDGQQIDLTPFDVTPAGRFAGHKVSGGQRPGRSFVTFSRFDTPALETWRARTVLLEQGAGGQSCTTTADCAPIFECVDGVCCNSACGGGVAGDCVACSVARGGNLDGTCTLVSGGQSCRAPVGECDVADVCDGVSAACPPDETRSGEVCSGGVCVGTTCEVDDGGLVFPDAGTDAGLDAGSDAGVSDAGVGDAGVGDAGSNADAGIGERALAVGCACTAVSPPQLLLLALAFRSILNRRFERRATSRDR